MDVVAGMDAPGTKSVDSFGRFGVDIFGMGRNELSNWSSQQNWSRVDQYIQL